MKIPRKTNDMNAPIPTTNVPIQISSPQDPRAPAAFVAGSIPPPPPPPPPPPKAAVSGVVVPIGFSASDIQNLQAQLPNGIIIPPGLDPKILLSSDVSRFVVY